ncbi:nuclear GTPase SLIP-GC [Heliangelus exortis]|uniref:nuclear GTPase SLIP-GC n=1 Tax=Heliangelus exortis TaxID=472823 RepID=UPI003A94D090
MSHSSVFPTLQQGRGGRGFHKTLRAVRVKHGDYTSHTFGRIAMNMCLAQPIYDKTDLSFGNMFRIQMCTCTTRKSCLDVVKEGIKKQLEEAMRNYPVQETPSFLQQEVDFVFRKTEKVILQERGKIYQSLTISIQNDLMPHHGAAASQRGADAFARMKNILSRGVTTEKENRMFEKAQERMKSHFQRLQLEIIQKMRKDFSSLLNLTFCPWDQLQGKLPQHPCSGCSGQRLQAQVLHPHFGDFSSEFSSICTIHQDLQPTGEAQESRGGHLR